MKVLNSKFRQCLLGIIAASILFAAAPFASADTLTIDSALSNVTFTLYLLSDPLDPESIFATGIGQGDVPNGLLPVGDGTRVPGYSNGLSAQLAGTIDVTSGGGNFSLDGGNNINLLDSGDWQPGVGAAPDPANIGAFLEFTLFNPNDSVVTAALRNVILSLSSASVPLGGGGAFNDPAGTFTLVSGTAAGVANTPLGAGPFSSALTTQSAASAMAGTYSGGVLNMPLATSVIIDLTEALGVGLGLRIDISGQLVTAVPEPSSVVLLGTGLVGLAFAGYRRIRK